MATLQEHYDLANGGALRGRVIAACAKAATDIVNENPLTANHANRMIWAAKDPAENAEQMKWPVALNATIAAAGAAATDGDIQFVVNSHINAFATG